jgi:eukaryotic-like serine/threonine-protein kinase
MKGQILSNRYFIAEEIGVGGMGVVYRAVNLRTGGDVAIKVPHTFLVRNDEFMSRLSREAQIAASLYSPRIVRVIDLDSHEGLPYLVMEYVPGETLADLARQRQRFSLAETLALGLEVARALDVAHAKGVVHRDLKPQNIKLVDGEVKVLDFGIAKGEGYANVTAKNAFIGTPEYCAPEQTHGTGDIRSDIYSLGVILFEMHEGHLPFQGATPFAIMRQHETEPPPPLTGEVPAAFQEIVSRCLAKDPADRYQTPRDLVQALRAVVESPTAALTATIADDAPPAIKPPNLADSAAVPATVAMPPDAPGTVPPPAGTAASTQIPRRRSRGPLLLAGAVAAVLLAGVAITALLAGGSNDGASATDTVDAGLDGTADVDVGGTARPRNADTAAAPLLLPGEQKSLTGQVKLDWTAYGCPGVKTVLDLRSIRAERSGRVVVAFTIETPRVLGVERCDLNLAPDAGCACVMLVTRLATGDLMRAQNTGGNGVAATGALNVYGANPMQGEWWFDQGVDLNGETLTLVREQTGSAGPEYRYEVLLLYR